MERRPRWHAGAYGAMSGIIGAACMSVVRGAARRAGLIEKTVPQVIEERVTEPFRESEDGSHLHGAIDQLMHLAYGATMGGAYGVLLGDRERSLAKSALALGLGTWLLGTALVIPILRAGRPAWRRGVTENAVDLVAHLVFGVATELARDDLRTHSEAGAVSSEEREAASTG